MATLNITTAKTRAQMVTELTNWADATKVSGNDYVWACADNITVQAEIELYGFDLTFASGKRIQASTNGVIKVSKVLLDTFYIPTVITVTGNGGVNNYAQFVAGNGRWEGSGLAIKADGTGVSFDTQTSTTKLYDLTVDAINTNCYYFRVKLNGDGELNLFRISGIAIVYVSGKLSMNPKGYGIVNSSQFNPPQMDCGPNGSVFNGLIVHTSDTVPLSTYSPATSTFIDSVVNPDHLFSHPKNNSSTKRIIKRTFTLKPKDRVQANISSFSYRIASNRVTLPGGAVTPNHQLAAALGTFDSSTVVTIWSGDTAEGGTPNYGPMKNQIIDKDITIQFRKYRYNEGEFKTNSYFYSVDAIATMLKDNFTKFSTPTLNNLSSAAELYDAIRSLVALDMDLPEDLFTTDGKVIAIKATWTLKRSATATNIAIDKTSKSITIDKDSYIAKYKALKWDYTRFAGTVDPSMTGHTNMIFARQDGKANLNLQITCPTGSLDPVAGVWLFSQGLDNRAGMITGQTTGTGITNITLIVDASAKYYCTAKALGSNQFAPFIIEPVGGLGGSKEITLFVYEKNDGTPLLPTTLTPAQTAIADTFLFHDTHIEIKIPAGFATNPRWSSTDKIWQYKAEDFIPIAYKLDVIQTALIMAGRNQLMFLQEGRILISAATNAKVLEQDPDNKTTVSSTTNVKVSLTTISMGRIGDTDARNTFIDNENGAIDVRGGVPINGGFSIADANRLVAIKTDTNGIGGVKTVVDANKVLATAIKNDTGTIKNDTGIIKTKANETHQRLALDSTKPLTNKPDGGITSTGINIVATELADGSIKQTRS